LYGPSGSQGFAGDGVGLSNVVESIRASFFEEAAKSPQLLGDLASLERYISESYTGRSLVELLQNADDAGAKRIFVKAIGNHQFLVANDGRAFNAEDVVALCRSGASTKSRRAGTIGYRGIGFKSVVNYASAVHLVSGDVALTFSRELTQSLLSSHTAVPLVRIPHPFGGAAFQTEIALCHAAGYETVFVFESRNDALLEEAKSFDVSCLLFLNNIQAAIFDASRSDNRGHIAVRSPHSSGGMRVSISSETAPEDWLVFSQSESPDSAAIAFRLQDDAVVALAPNEAVVHSFMPTHDHLRFPVRINGDFSTDPSRTRVVMDDETRVALDGCAEVMADLCAETLETRSDPLRILGPLSEVTADPLAVVKGRSISDELHELFVLRMKAHLDRAASFGRMMVQPEWLGEDQFLEIVAVLGSEGISKGSEADAPGTLSFLHSIGVPVLSEDEGLVAAGRQVLSRETRAVLLARIIQKSRFGMSRELKDSILRAHLLDFESGTMTTREAAAHGSPDKDFVKQVQALLTDPADMGWFLGAFDIDSSQLAKTQKSPARKDSAAAQHTFSRPSSVKKWRSAEQNVAGVLEASDGVLRVEDVSVQNLGYDLVVTHDDGSKLFVEVKSVSRLGDSISITNNEYSTAVQEGSRYCLAIAEQSGDTISICLVMNPTDALRLQKRVTRWEWVCDEYTGELLDHELSGG
jgi:hypothetical protein